MIENHDSGVVIAPSRRPGRMRVLFAALAAGGALLALILAEGPAVSASDYLPRSLRAEVERLEADIAREPTSAKNAVARAETLWKWGNAFARQGWAVHPELPTLVARIKTYEPTRTEILDTQYRLLDMLVADLAMREAEGGTIGRLTLANPGPFPAGSHATLVQTYVVGREGIAPGGGFLVPHHWMAGLAAQTHDPAADNYVTIRSTNAAAGFKAESAMVNGYYAGGVNGYAPRLFFRLAEGRLEEGDEVTITLGDRAGGSKGMRLPQLENDRIVLPLFVRLKKDGPFLTLPPGVIATIGVGAAGVAGFAPSVAAVGEKVTISVRSEDESANRAGGSIPGYLVSLNGAPYGRIPPGGKAIHLLEASFDREGAYQFSFLSEDGRIAGRSNTILVRKDPRERVYWGETHGHAGASEGLGTARGYLAFARDDARLDFVSLTEHDVWLDDHEWEELRAVTQEFLAPGRFVTYLGYEWTNEMRVGGHHNVMFRTPEGRARVAVQSATDLGKLYAGLAAENDPRDVLILPHAHETADWKLNDASMETLVEIMSQHGTFEWFGRRYSERFAVGFIAGSDNHVRHPGYRERHRGSGGSQNPAGLAGVLAPELGVDAIFDALKERRAYATDGARIIVDFAFDVAAMGSQIGAGPGVVRADVTGTAPIDRITVVKNGEDVHSAQYRDAAAGEGGILELRVYSDSDPHAHGIYPRDWRRWKGRLRLAGASLEGLDVPYHSRNAVDSAQASASGDGAIAFQLRTRGNAKTILLDLAGIGAGAALEIEIEEDRSSRWGEPNPAFAHRFELQQLLAGPQTVSQPAGPNVDTVTARFVTAQAPLQQSFRWTDPAGARAGDYYYLRIEQSDGGTAWTSPVRIK